MPLTEASPPKSPSELTFAVVQSLPRLLVEGVEAGALLHRLHRGADGAVVHRLRGLGGDNLHIGVLRTSTSGMSFQLAALKTNTSEIAVLFGVPKHTTTVFKLHIGALKIDTSGITFQLGVLKHTTPVLTLYIASGL